MSIKGYKSQQALAKKLANYTEDQSIDPARYVTVQEMPGRRHALDVTMQGCYQITSSPLTVASGSNIRVIKCASHGANKNDIIRLSNGTQFSALSIPDTNTIVTSVELDVDPTGDTFTIWRYITPSYNADGSMNVLASSGPIQYVKNAVNTQVNRDTSIPANNKPLPVELLDNSGNALDLSVGILTKTISGVLSGSTSATGSIIASTDAKDYSHFSVQLTGTWVGTVNIQVSNDNTNWANILAVPVGNTSSLPISSITSNGLYLASAEGKYIRVQCTAYTSGTIVASVDVSGGNWHDINAKYVSVMGLADGTQKTQIVDSSNNSISSIDVASGTLVGSKAIAVANTATYFIVSSNNSSTTQLAASATFNGVVETAFSQEAFSILMTSDQPITLNIFQYIDAAGTRLAQQNTFTILANAGFARSYPINGNYVKVTAQNTGASTTTTFNLNVAYGQIPAANQLGNAPVSLGDVNGTAISLGQAASTASIPVVLSTRHEAAATPISQRQTDGTNFLSSIALAAAQLTSGALTAIRMGAAITMGWDGTTHRELSVDTTGKAILATRHEAAATPLAARVSDGTNFLSSIALAAAQLTSGALTAIRMSAAVVMGWDGTTHRELAVDTSGNIKTAPQTYTGTITTAQLTVGTTAVRATVAGTAPSSTRKKVRIKPSKSNTGAIFIGPSTVTTANGIEVIGPDVQEFNFDASDYYVISDTASQKVEILEVV